MSIATISLQGDNITLKGGATSVFQFTIVNNSDQAKRLGFRIKPLDAKDAQYFELQGDVERDFEERETQTVLVKATAPKESGKISFILEVYSTKDPEQVTESMAASVVVGKEETPGKKEPKEDRLIWPWIAGGSVLLLVVIGTVIFLVTRPAKIPDVMAMHYEEAVAEFDKDEIEVNVNEVISEGEELVDPGIVLNQEPPAGEKYPEDNVINLTVEAFSIEIPALTNVTLAQAEELLLESELVLGEVVEVDARSPSPLVLDQDPKSGQRVIPNTPVKLTVAKQKVRVPRLSGQTVNEAIAALSELGLRRGNISEKKTNATPGIVLSTKPVDGQEVNLGQAVNLIIETSSIQVPALTEMKMSRAIEILKAQGLNYHVSRKRTKRVRPGMVFDQRPKASTKIKIGQTVKLYVEASKRPSTRPSSYTYSTALQGQIKAIQSGQLKLNENPVTKIRSVESLDGSE